MALPCQILDIFREVLEGSASTLLSATIDLAVAIVLRDIDVQNSEGGTIASLAFLQPEVIYWHSFTFIV